MSSSTDTPTPTPSFNSDDHMANHMLRILWQELGPDRLHAAYKRLWHDMSSSSSYPGSECEEQLEECKRRVITLEAQVDALNTRPFIPPSAHMLRHFIALTDTRSSVDEMASAWEAVQPIVFRMAVKSQRLTLSADSDAMPRDLDTQLSKLRLRMNRWASGVNKDPVCKALYARLLGDPLHGSEEPSSRILYDEVHPTGRSTTALVTSWLHGLANSTAAVYQFGPYSRELIELLLIKMYRLNTLDDPKAPILFTPPLLVNHATGQAAQHESDIAMTSTESHLGNWLTRLKPTDVDKTPYRSRRIVGCIENRVATGKIPPGLAENTYWSTFVVNFDTETVITYDVFDDSAEARNNVRNVVTLELSQTYGISLDDMRMSRWNFLYVRPLPFDALTASAFQASGPLAINVISVLLLGSGLELITPPSLLDLPETASVGQVTDLRDRAIKRYRCHQYGLLDEDHTQAAKVFGLFAAGDIETILWTYFM